MIIDYEKMVCIITPPKNGSTSLNMALRDGRTIAEGPQFCNHTVGTHSASIPYYTRHRGSEFTYYLLTRNPYDRLLSLYGHWLNELDQTESFDFFVKRVMLVYHDPFYSTPTSAWKVQFDLSYPEFKLLELPLLQSQHILKTNHGIEFDLLQYNISQHYNVKQAYNDELIQIVKYWAHFDFEWFGYDSAPYWEKSQEIS